MRASVESLDEHVSSMQDGMNANNQKVDQTTRMIADLAAQQGGAANTAKESAESLGTALREIRVERAR